MDKQQKLISAIVATLLLAGFTILTGVNIYLMTSKSTVETKYLNLETKNVNITDLKINNTCLMESNRYLLGKSLYAHTCYNVWLDQSIVDLHYLEDGNVTLNFLSNKWIPLMHMKKKMNV